MEQHRVGEDAVIAAARQVELEEVLHQHLATAVATRHPRQLARTVEAGSVVAELR